VPEGGTQENARLQEAEDDLSAAAAAGSTEENMEEGDDYGSCVEDNDDEVDREQQPAGNSDQGDNDQQMGDKTAMHGGDQHQQDDSAETVSEPTTNWADVMEPQPLVTSPSKDNPKTTGRGQKKSTDIGVVVDHSDGSTTPSPAESGYKRTRNNDQADAVPSKVVRRQSLGADVGFDPTSGRSKARSPVTAPSARKEKSSVNK